MEKPTKYYSSKQEHMIADYLGWSVVSGSGSRSFNPGDVRSDEFLGECKTHSSPVDKITIRVGVWNKIKKEAVSVFKRPVLFVDNGTQSVQHTWCIVHEKFVPDETQIVRLDTNLIHQLFRESSKQITFSHLDVKCTFKQHADSYDAPISMPFICDGDSLLLLELKTFKYIFGDDG